VLRINGQPVAPSIHGQTDAPDTQIYEEEPDDTEIFQKEGTPGDTEVYAGSETTPDSEPSNAGETTYNFCFQCGQELIKFSDPKFCPQCGLDLR
jgi:hypothetical protein